MTGGQSLCQLQHSTAAGLECAIYVSGMPSIQGLCSTKAQLNLSRPPLATQLRPHSDKKHIYKNGATGETSQLLIDKLLDSTDGFHD